MDNSKLEVVRPTEAQLRWAQFHKKKRSRETIAKVEQLYSTPSSPSQVSGAVSDVSSDESSIDSNSSDIFVQRLLEKRMSRPAISKGRKALLKVSKRSFDKRRELVAKKGFQCWGDDELEHDKENEADVFGDILDESFVKKHRKRRQSRLSRALPQSEDVERMQRFEAAYAMILKMKPQQQPLVVRSGKRWTRPDHISAAVSIDGRSFEDWKWGLARRNRTAKRQSRLGNMPFDRRASWLVHLPTMEKRRQANSQSLSSDGQYIEPIALYNGHPDEFLMSPQRMKFDEMVSRLQNAENPYPNHPYPDQDVSARYLDNLPQQELVGSPRIIRRSRVSMEDDFEHIDPPNATGRRSEFSVESDFFSKARLMEVPEEEIPMLYHQFQRGLALGAIPESQPQTMDQHETFNHQDAGNGIGVIQSGRLSSADSIGMSSVGMRSIGGTRVSFSGDTKSNSNGRVSAAYSTGATSIGDESDFFAEARRGHEAPENRDSLGLSSVTESRGSLESGDSDPFADFRRTSGAGSDSLYGLQFSGDSPQQTGSHVSGTGRSESVDRLGNEFSRDGSDSTCSLQTPRSKSRESAIFDNTTPNEHCEGEDKAGTGAESLSSFRMGAKMAGGLFNMVTGRKSDGDHSSDVDAVEAFKSRQDERRESAGDDATSTSSFRVLPDGLRRMVQGLTSNRDLADDADENAGNQSPDLPYHEGSMSPSRSVSSAPFSVKESVSPEHGRMLQHNMTKASALIGDGEEDRSVIDTDDTTSDASGAKMDPKEAAALLLSPAILAKRLQQAIRAVEKRNWEQVTYLVSANPWLAEMMQSSTQQYLLHKVSLHGASKVLWADEDEAFELLEPAPEKLNMDLMRIFPNSVHKFDAEGNLPLHMAAASGNFEMVTILGEKFSSGASVRNNDGMLPLHLAIQACSAPIANREGEPVHGGELIEVLLRMFPAGVAITDNEGDLPLHIASAALEGEVGVDIIYLLLDEADRQAKEGNVLRFANKFKPHKIEDDNESISTDITETPTDSSNMDSEVVYCTLARNEMGRTPLAKAIEAGSGWQVIEAIARGPGGHQAALVPDIHNSNALHNLVSEEFGDPQAALSILKIAPKTATIRNTAGMLPIEVACQQGMPHEVIVAMVLVDLPMDLNDQDGAKIREGYGESWWFLTCECDDHYVDVVEEVVSICSYQHLRELCFMKSGQNKSSGSVISRATPQCRSLLRKALRFVGRYEFLGTSAIYIDEDLGLKVFDAIDFGEEDGFDEEGQRVFLNCYSKEKEYTEETFIIQNCQLDPIHFEVCRTFAVHETIAQGEEDIPRQWCVAIERPTLTLDKVVEGMQRNEEYRHNEQMRNKYLNKVCIVLRLAAKSLRHLHGNGIVHGDVCLENCGKFGDKWKLMSMIGVQEIGQLFAPSRLGESSPPESVDMLHDIIESRTKGGRQRATFISQLEAKPSADIWAFGKLAFESLTGESLIKVDPAKDIRNDNRALLNLRNWNESDLRSVIESLRSAGISNLGVDLVTLCLLPNARDRPKAMDEIIDHPFWKDMRRKKMTSKPKIGRDPRNSLHEV